MSAVTLMNNEENMAQDKEKLPSYNSSTSFKRLHQLVFAYYTGHLITVFIFFFDMKCFQIRETYRNQLRKIKFFCYGIVYIIS